jgi:hypothetical protein
VTAVLARGANFEISAVAGIVRCNVMNPAGVDREEGARCADQMRETLVMRVLIPMSEYLGAVFDVRQGPEVFGPITRGTLEVIFRAAETSERRLAVRIGGAAMQQLQFASLCRECAPSEGKLVESDVAEEAWLRGRTLPRSSRGSP